MKTHGFRANLEPNNQRCVQSCRRQERDVAKQRCIPITTMVTSGVCSRARRSSRQHCCARFGAQPLRAMASCVDATIDIQIALPCLGSFGPTVVAARNRIARMAATEDKAKE